MDPITILIVAVIVVGGGYLAYQEGEADDVLEGVERGLTVAMGVTISGFMIAASVLTDLGSIATDAPGIAATAVTGAVGSLALGDVVELAPQAFAVLALVGVGWVLIVRGSD